MSDRTKEVARFSPSSELQDGAQESGLCSQELREMSLEHYGTKTLMCEGDICICSCKWPKQCSLDPSYQRKSRLTHGELLMHHVGSPEWFSLAISLEGIRTWVQIPSLSPWWFFLEFFPATLRMKPKLWTMYPTEPLREFPISIFFGSFNLLDSFTTSLAKSMSPLFLGDEA